jgi:hypothetical protein
MEAAMPRPQAFDAGEVLTLLRLLVQGVFPGPRLETLIARLEGVT